MSVNGCLSLMDWWCGSGVPCLTPSDSWDKLQDGSINERMDRWMVFLMVMKLQKRERRAAHVSDTPRLCRTGRGNDHISWRTSGFHKAETHDLHICPVKRVQWIQKKTSDLLQTKTIMSIEDLGSAPPSKLSALIPQKKNTHSATFTYFNYLFPNKIFYLLWLCCSKDTQTETETTQIRSSERHFSKTQRGHRKASFSKTNPWEWVDNKGSNVLEKSDVLFTVITLWNLLSATVLIMSSCCLFSHPQSHISHYHWIYCHLLCLHWNEVTVWGHKNISRSQFGRLLKCELCMHLVHFGDKNLTNYHQSPNLFIS